MPKLTERQVCVEDIVITYILERKHVKNLNLRVRPDGSVHVSAPYGAKIDPIDTFVEERVDFILRAQEHFKKRQEAQAQLEGKEYNYGDIIYLLGKPMAVAHKESERNEVVFTDSLVMLYLVDTRDIALRKRLMRKALDELCEDVFQVVLRKEYELVRPYGVPFPTLRMRSMKTRWGTCNFVKGIVTMNKRLIHMPLPCVEQVMLHELCHFLVGNHSPRFYAWLDRLMPDWRERRAVLNSWDEESR